MTVSLTFDFRAAAVETLSTALDFASNPDITTQILQEGTASLGVLNASSTPAVSRVWSDSVGLTAGALTLNLAALSRGAELAALDLTGLKVQFIKIFSKSANTSSITMSTGASNGYAINLATRVLEISPGECMMFKRNESLPDVASGARTIDFASSDVDAIFDIMIVAG